ncbi:MAG: putative Na+/H+ antiporter [Bdellovibrionales bacterium]
MDFSQPVELAATCCFVLALFHTFSVHQFQKLATHYRPGSVGENLFHLLGEVEVVFGIWAGIFLLTFGLMDGGHVSASYLEKLDFTEPVFVFVVMTVASTKPILEWSNRALEFLAHLLPLPNSVSYFVVVLIMGPLMGSFITEPAAMTVAALLLHDRYFAARISDNFKYLLLGALFVNVSIGGTLTPFAAPPVLMVAGKWNWDMIYMMKHFGWKSALACAITTGLLTAAFYQEIKKLPVGKSKKVSSPVWIAVLHFLVLAAIVMVHNKMILFMGMFLFFLGLVTVTKEYHKELKLRESLLVAFFLGGLVVLGKPQAWWLEDVLTRLNSVTLFLGSIGLTAIVDNAALTFLGSQVPDLSEVSKHALVAGAVVGGGLTVIANAPNPAGYSILNSAFGEEGISPLKLFVGALPPTLIAGLCLWFL